MTAFYSSLATLLISYTIYRFPGVIFGIVCAHLFGNHCLEYLRKRRFHRILKQLTNSNMECECRWWATRKILPSPGQHRSMASSRCIH
jgi:hypothetical protein